MIRPSSRIDVAIRTRLSLGWASHRSIARSQSSIELAENALDGGYPVRVEAPADHADAIGDVRGEASHVLPVRLDARVRPAAESGSCSGTSRHAIPESTSEEGTGSRLPWLPRDIQQNSAGGGPSLSMPSSIILAISASATAEVTSLTWSGESSARWSVTTVEFRRPAIS